METKQLSKTIDPQEKRMIIGDTFINCKDQATKTVCTNGGKLIIMY